jgi:hypothetical protein
LAGMTPREPSADCSYADLARIVDDNCEPFFSIEQCDRFIKAASILRRREPSETEEDGIRVSKRDLMDQIAEARKAREALTITTAQRVTVVVPAGDCC